MFVKIKKDSYKMDEAETESYEKKQLQNSIKQESKNGGKKSFVKVLEDSKERVITGPVIVTKNPCSHPGDTRKVTATDHEDFSKKFYVIGRRRY